GERIADGAIQARADARVARAFDRRRRAGRRDSRSRCGRRRSAVCRPQRIRRIRIAAEAGQTHPRRPHRLRSEPRWAEVAPAAAETRRTHRCDPARDRLFDRTNRRIAIGSGDLSVRGVERSLVATMPDADASNPGNPIHSTDTARDYGFRAALVGGATIYG